ncbi:hypothetical protein VST7929_00406 [Vibrio stylophorae]|uniref:Chitobiase n=1 Tax=Vibrio stylophorae TaxID=659351 RepID=A0ABN8DRJ6_9VIBR|nr:glycoside hydrolase family 9 protein [Vibrio stylophorae]CAH0532575.1 hypothetical protein VST7929_00406 [Vibrio stylophorae]
MQLFVNHLGFERFSAKVAVLNAPQSLATQTATLRCVDTQQAVLQLPVIAQGSVDEWHQGKFYTIDFSEFTTPGNYRIEVAGTCSHDFVIGSGVLMTETLTDVIHYFKSQRCGGVFDRFDKAVPIFGSDRTADVTGGWYDASGDVSKYFTHLSYSNFFNPQQIPMVCWNMLHVLDSLKVEEDFAKFTHYRLTEEAIFGVDFLYRMQDDEGYFYTTIFDRWSKSLEQREICAYATQQGHKSDDYQAGFRQGAGVAIAALAAASRLTAGGEFTPAQYLAAAEKGYWHLVEHNCEYLNDGVENIIDEYCALLGAVELYRATDDCRYLVEARQWAERLCARQQSDEQMAHFWSATADGSRPYFHAAEAGLPVIALSQYLLVETQDDLQTKVRTVIAQAVSFELNITKAVTNPFGYPRQYVKDVNGDKRDSFFVAQNNETGYWWQGENARIASLAAMAYIAQDALSDPLLQQALRHYGDQCLNWIVGLNPYDMCMLDGHGHNNPDYLPELGFHNAMGGVCNGITAGFDNPRDIAFKPEGQAEDMLQNWRWGEQWIPHGAWYLLAICMQAKGNQHD